MTKYLTSWQSNGNCCITAGHPKFYALTCTNVLSKLPFDDTQLYFTFESGDESNLEITLAKCMADIKSWMVVNFLQLNPSKTEVIIISPKYDQSCSPAELKISSLDDAHVVNQTVKSLGFYLDSSLSMSDQITSVVQACNIQSRNLWFIASKLTYDLKIQLVHSLVLSRLDYCNSMYHGITLKDLGRLQKVQNSAVRFIFGRGKRAQTTQFRGGGRSWNLGGGGATFEFLFTTLSRRRFAPPRSQVHFGIPNSDKLTIHLTSPST